MQTAKVKVLELLADGKISVDDATLLLDAMGHDTSTAQQTQTTTSSDDKNSETAKQTDINIEDFVRDTFQNVTDTVRKGVQTADEQLKKAKEQRSDSDVDPFQQLEKTLREFSDRLNKK